MEYQRFGHGLFGEYGMTPLKTKGEGRVVIYWMSYPNTNNDVG